MAGVNKVILIGNLGSDPEVRHLQNDVTVANFNIATTEYFKDKQSGERRELTEWHRVVVWRWHAQTAEKYLRKGSKVYIEGKLRTRKWQDKDGLDRYTTEIHAEEMNMLDRPTGDSGQGQDQGQAPRQQSSSTELKTPSAVNEGPEEDDLPF